MSRVFLLLANQWLVFLVIATTFAIFEQIVGEGKNNVDHVDYHPAGNYNEEQHVRPNQREMQNGIDDEERQTQDCEEKPRNAEPHDIL